jgi:hypothetical protein
VTVVTKEMFLRSYKPPVEDVPLPEIGPGVVIRVRGMTTRERSDFERQFMSKSGERIPGRTQEMRERLLVWACVDENNVPLFSMSDIRAIGEQNSVVTERIVDVAQRLCGMGKINVEEIEKNSEETPAG